MYEIGDEAIVNHPNHPFHERRVIITGSFRNHKRNITIYFVEYGCRSGKIHEARLKRPPVEREIDKLIPWNEGPFIPESIREQVMKGEK